MVLVDDVVDEERLFEVASLRCLPKYACSSSVAPHRWLCIQQAPINDENDLYLK